MTHYIAHRVNTISQLSTVPLHFGVELDLRDEGGELVLQHDPFLPVNSEKPEYLRDYLKSYQHGTLILNIKSERIEHRVIELIKEANVKNYFFLDSSFPMINLLSAMGERNCAIRFSEFEGLDTIKAMQGRIQWVWVDCFTKLPIDKESYEQLKDMGFKLCLVSPELQGRPEDIQPYKQFLQSSGIIFDAICTKIHNVDQWQR